MKMQALTTVRCILLKALAIVIITSNHKIMITIDEINSDSVVDLLSACLILNQCQN